MNEQSLGAGEIVKAVNAMRQSAASTARALSEQSTATDQVARETDRLARQVAGISRAMGEQAASAQEIAAAADHLAQQSTQASRAIEEQARAVKDITTSGDNIARQIKLITSANQEHSRSAARILGSIAEVRTLSDANARDLETNVRSLPGRRVGSHPPAAKAAHEAEGGRGDGRKSSSPRARRSRQSLAMKKASTGPSKVR
jgi:methyl-accepting chemotaxis protein